MKTSPILIILFFLLSSCIDNKKTGVELMVEANAIYSMDSVLSVYQAMIINNGKIIALGTKESLLQQFNPKKSEHYTGYIFPGFIDAHCHFLGLVKTRMTVDLQGSLSWQEVLERCVDYAKENPEGWITGRGWDQSLWQVDELPSNRELNELFPERPVIIRRVDGHAAIANKLALKLAGLDNKSVIEGGDIVKNTKGELSGLLIDNAMQPVMKLIPPPSKEQLIKGIISTGKYLNDLGLTTLADAGMDSDEIQLIDSLQQTGLLNLRFYAMYNATDANLEFAKKGILDKPMLVARSFKFYADGALGSEGAKLKKPYCTQQVHDGLFITDPEKLEWWYHQMYSMGFQAHTHCIGDSANALVLNLYHKVMKANPTLRWRIEHAQVVDTIDFRKFIGIIPSVQPVHASSDRRWAQKKLCSHRMKGAYAYNTLLKTSGILAIGTDFPVESPDPLMNFKSATMRRNQTTEDWNGILSSEGLSQESAVLGMTQWAAYSVFMENYCGTLKPDMSADFIVLSHDLLNEIIENETNINILQTYFNGLKLKSAN